MKLETSCRENGLVQLVLVPEDAHDKCFLDKVLNAVYLTNAPMQVNDEVMILFRHSGRLKCKLRSPEGGLVCDEPQK